MDIMNIIDNFLSWITPVTLFPIQASLPVQGKLSHYQKWGSSFTP